MRRFYQNLKIRFGILLPTLFVYFAAIFNISFAQSSENLNENLNQKIDQIVDKIYYPKSQGKLEYDVYSVEYKINFGTYSYSWNVDENSYQVNTSLVARGIVGLMVDYHYEEMAIGEVISKDDLAWKEYRYSQIFEENKKPAIHKYAKITPNGESIKLHNYQKKVGYQPFDIPSLILHLMRKPQEIGSSYQFDVLNSSKAVEVEMKLEGIEKIKIPLGEYETWYWEGQNDTFVLKIWYDKKNLMPVQFYFISNKGNAFSIKAKAIL